MGADRATVRNVHDGSVVNLASVMLVLAPDGHFVLVVWEMHEIGILVDLKGL